jgi:hypothetical protein
VIRIDLLGGPIYNSYCQIAFDIEDVMVGCCMDIA